MTPRILIVEDDPVQRRVLEAAVAKMGYQTATADDGDVALEWMRENKAEPADVIILDLVMPKMDGLAVMGEMAKQEIKSPVIVQTARGGVDVAVSAMRAGAFDFCVKPASPDKLKQIIADALKVTTSSKQLSPEKVERKTHNGPAFIGESEPVKRVKSLVAKAAASDIPVLVEGESGTGKELIARSVQGQSERSRAPFVIVNCGAIPENLVETILFGHEKGAFTGATEKHIGKFIEADGGTLFLDEIGELPLDAQVKVLRAIQNGEVEPVGARGNKKVNVRLVSATNRDLIAAVREGSFREDLYYRLNVFPVVVPPLRHRREDIRALVDYFIKEIAAETKFAIKPVSEDALRLLSAHDWPGNVRQLQNAIFRAMVLCETKTLDVEHFPQIEAQVNGIHIDGSPPIAPEYKSKQALALPKEAVQTEASASPYAIDEELWLRIIDESGHARPLSDLEAEVIAKTISRYQGRMSEVARRLGIGRSTLYRKLKEHDIEPSELI